MTNDTSTPPDASVMCRHGPSQLVHLPEDSVWQLDSSCSNIPWALQQLLLATAADSIKPGQNCRGVFANSGRPAKPSGKRWHLLETLDQFFLLQQMLALLASLCRNDAGSRAQLAFWDCCNLSCCSPNAQMALCTLEHCLALEGRYAKSVSGCTLCPARNVRCFVGTES